MCCGIGYVQFTHHVVGMQEMICVTIRYFAHLREMRGLSDETLSISGPCTVGELFAQLFEMSSTGIRFAINAEYVDATAMVADGDEVVFLPPMGGG